jgi:hypothetical protein
MPFAERVMMNVNSDRGVSMGINTITQAFEKTEREKEGKIKRYKLLLGLSLGLNIILIIFIFSGAL